MYIFVLNTPISTMLSFYLYSVLFKMNRGNSKSIIRYLLFIYKNTSLIINNELPLITITQISTSRDIALGLNLDGLIEYIIM